MKDDILMTLFGGGSADYDMLDKCNYDFKDILRHIDSFTTREDMDFNDILIGAIDEYKSNLEEAIENKKRELEDNWKYLENKLEVCGYGKRDLMEDRTYYNGDDIILLELQKDTLYEKYNDRAEIIAELKNNLKEVGIIVDDDYINKHFGYVNGSYFA